MDYNKMFNDFIKNGDVLVDFYADWCGPCKMLAPVIEQIAKERSDLKVVKVNIDEAQDIAMQYGVMSIPTLMVFVDGNVKTKSVGYAPKDTILSLL